MKKVLVILVTAVLIILCGLSVGQLQRYPIGQLVASSIYTEPFDPCDPAYKFLQAPPKDWAEKFGNNERTLLIHAVSELRVVVAAQGKRLLALEDWRNKVNDPNSPERLIKFQYSTDKPQFADPNEAKR